jgi:hypothetical protein
MGKNQQRKGFPLYRLIVMARSEFIFNSNRKSSISWKLRHNHLNAFVNAKTLINAHVISSTTNPIWKG